ncbi:MAG: TonB-dependent receptor [Caulobacteraceae bacterium]|nr:TonB-dependent receptor [Caulobacter sp.]
MSLLCASVAVSALTSGRAARAQSADPQGPGAPPPAAGNQAGGRPAEQGAPSSDPQPQAPGGGQAPTGQGAAAPNPNASALTEVVVTATRSATNLQKTPVAVTPITTEQLQERGVTTLQNIAQLAPSLSISTNGARISIRGISVDTTSPQPAVGVYLDDVYYPVASANALGLFDINRLEVLRGPQGTLFGRNTIAGAIQYVSNQPTQTFGGYFDAIGGSYSRHDFQGAINIPLTDTLALRVAANTQNRDGFVKDLYTGDERGAVQQGQIRTEIKWTPTDRLTITLEGQYSHFSTNGRALIDQDANANAQFAGLAKLFGETRPLTSAYDSTSKYSFPGFNKPDFSQNTFREGQGVISYKLNDHIDLKSITAYSSTSQRVATDFDQTPLNILSLGASDADTNVLTEEDQIIGHFLDDRLRFTLGVYYFDSKAPSRNVPGVVIGYVTEPSAGDTETDIQSEAGYGQATLNLTRRLSITGGLRYSNEQNTAYQLAAGSPRLRSSFSNTSPYIGLNYQATNNAFLYAKYSEGFLAGGQTVNANLPNGSLPFQPETADTYEVGARLEFFHHRLRFNPTFFYTDWNQIQFNLLIPEATNIVTATQNAGDATIHGFEFEGQWEVTERLLFSANASFNDSHYNRVPALTYNIYPRGFPGPAQVLPNITVNSPLERSPDTKVSVTGRYAVPVTDRSRLVASVSATYTSSQYSAVTISDAIRLPSYTLVQARIQYDFGGDKYSAALFATNLTDAYYFTDGIGFGQGYTVGVNELDPGRPREIGGELTVRF